MDFEMIVIKIINHSGEARSLSMDGIRYAKNNDMKKARKCIEEANEKLSLAHKSQTTLIHEEAQGNKREISLLLIHAQDHLMNAITMRDLANELIDVYSKMTE